MSSRVLRKLGLGDKELSLGDEGSDDTEADFSSSSSSKKPLNINRYGLLNQSHSESEVKEDDNDTAGSLDNQDIEKENKRKKKKKKKKPVKVQNARSSEDNVDDEVEKSVREVNAILGEISSMPVQQVSTCIKKSVLNIDHRALNPNNELRRIFGSKIVQGDQIKKRRNRAHVRSTLLVTPKDRWPPIRKTGLSMKILETKNGIIYFTYEHSLNYQKVQASFLDAVETLNPDNIVSIINHHDYHVDALLQLSDICKVSEDLTMATELVQRALYCLECAFHPSFIVTSGNCRLDYRRQENRSLFIAMFKHMNYISSRTCYRTALEFCKLILSLDPEGDPLAVILAMDFFALRCQEYQWFIRIVNEWEATKNLSQLPNFAYSLAVAHFQTGDVETAHELLQKALMMFPGVLIPLTEKCNVQIDPRIHSSNFFVGAKEKQTKPLTQLEMLYVERCYHIWKESELLPWLENNVHKVLDRVESNDPLIIEYGTNRKKRYSSIPRNVLRHIILSDIKDLNIITTEEMQTTTFNFDPLPPLDSINLYTRTPRVYENNSMLSLFLRSFMPNFNINQLEEEEAGQEEHFQLRRSVATLIDAMRDLLTNINMPEVPGDGDIEDADTDG